MPNYKLKPGFNHYETNPETRERYKVKAGSIITMTEERYQNLRDRFTPVEQPEETESASAAETDWSFITKSNIADVLEMISKLEDKEQAAKIYEAEENGKAREKILNAARAKYVELGGEVD